MKKLLICFIGAIILLIVFLLSYSFFAYKTLLPNDELIISALNNNTSTTLTTLPDNFSVPDKFKMQVLLVLNNYPELVNEKVAFVYKEIGTTMATQPKPDINVFSKENRTYNVIINTNTNNTTFNFDSLDNTCQIAWIAHEFGHILDYKSRNTLSLIGMGINYVFSPEYKKLVEKFAHKSAVFHGFGEETYYSTSFAFESNRIADVYKHSMKTSYLSPDDVQKMIAEYNSFKNNNLNE